MPTSTFQEKVTLTLVPVASLPEERRCQSRPGCARVLDGLPRRPTCNELESPVSSFFGSSSACSFSTRGVAIGGSGVRTNPPRARKGPQKSVFFFFFFLSGIAQESVIVEKDERTPPTENKSCKTRHGQVKVRMALRPNAVAAKENQPWACVQDEAWPGANAKHRPIGRYPVELSLSMASVQQHRLIKERLRCQHVQLKVVETTMGRKEQRERERKEAAKGS